MLMKIKRGFILVSATALLACAVAAVVHAQHQTGTHAQHGDKSAAAHDCPHASKSAEVKPDKPGESKHEHDGHLAAAGERGEKAMGFSQTRTTHHFLLKADGGAIQVEADDPRDAESRDRIRKHLAHIARAFSEGDFRTPMSVHDRTPPGVHEMCRLRTSIKYEYEETGRGGRVRVRTGDKEALAAIHEFLRFQIKDHQTGDALEISN